MKIHRVWYAGAYTVQLCTIDSGTGDAITPTAGYPYHNNWGVSVLVNGAKRDRLVRPGNLVSWL